MAGRSGLSVIPDPEEVSVSQNDRMRAALEAVLGWAEEEGVGAPPFNEARELLEEHK